MTHRRRGPSGLILIVLCVAALVDCGKKGPPLAPLARVPAAPGSPQAARFGDDVYIWFTVPSANTSGQSPADITAVDLYAVTAVAPPAADEVTRITERLATYPVHVPVALPAVPDDAPPPPPLPALPGFAQGATAVVRETLTPASRAATPRPVPPAAAGAEAAAEEPLPGPLVAPPESSLRRHYFLVPVGPRGRPGAPTAALSVPVTDAADPPSEVSITYTEAALTLAWRPAATARPAPPPPAPDSTLLPSKALVAPPAPTAYHVFEVPRDQAPDPGPYGLTLPSPLTPQPVTTDTFEVPGRVAFGTERCFVVRPVDQTPAGVIVGRASAPACVTPVDTFPPAAPRQLAAIAGVGVINLIWEANEETDLAGYIVLRGPAPDGPFQALTPEPIRDTTYRDASATPGVRYVYAVVAVDTASPPNVSAQSNRVEEESRTP